MIQPPKPRPLAEVGRLARGLSGLPYAFARARAVGSGGTVLVLPGFATGDAATLALRSFLQRSGYRAEGWRLGINRGDVRALTPRVVDRIRSLSQERQEPIRLVGWSLGGVLAREAARQAPDCVAAIVTLGTPVVGGPKYTLVADYYRKRGVDLDALERSVADANRDPIRAPITAIYSPHDGVVAWRACFDDNPANDVRYVEMPVGHAELGFSGPVFRVVAEALADDRSSRSSRG